MDNGSRDNLTKLDKLHSKVKPELLLTISCVQLITDQLFHLIYLLLLNIVETLPRVETLWEQELKIKCTQEYFVHKFPYPRIFGKNQKIKSGLLMHSACMTLLKFSSSFHLIGLECTNFNEARAVSAMRVTSGGGKAPE